MHRIGILLLLGFFALPALRGQSVGDCTGAITVCSDLYEETDAPVGTGSLWEVAPGTCQTSGEFNSVWYSFTVQESGVLNFVLTPNNLDDDYDWSLYNISDNGCAGISSGASPEVSCNSWGTLFPPNGTTGISTALGGSGSSNGPGDLLGPPFNEDLFVNAGDTYALVVMNWSGSIQGYSLDFGQAEASIFDDEAPALVSVLPNCSGEEIEIVFSEGVLISSVEPEDFQITGTGGDFTVAAVAEGADASAGFAHTFYLSIPGGIAPEGNYTLTVLDVMNYVEDACGNVFSGSADFFVSDPLSFGHVITASCNGENGSIELTDAQGGTPPLSFFLEGVEQSGLFAEGLEPGFYDVSLVDATGCSVSQALEVTNFMLSVNAGIDLVPCAMETALDGSATGGTLLWSGPAEVTFANSALGTTNVEASQPGSYTLFLDASLGTCAGTDAVTVIFSPPLQPEFSITDASCHDFCDGAVVLTASGGLLTFSLNGSEQVTDSAAFAALCAGTYPWWVIDAAGCSASGTAVISQPPAIAAAFETNPSVASVTSPGVQFTNLSAGATASYWTIGYPPVFETDSASFYFEFPPLSGNYEVTLTVTDAYGCTDSESRVVVVADNFLVFVPNAFTPNQDKINDVFLPACSYLPERYSLVILDRWGTVMFDTLNPEEAWTGAVRGGAAFAQDGIYQWIIEAKGNDPEAIRLEGYVALIR